LGNRGAATKKPQGREGFQQFGETPMSIWLGRATKGGRQGVRKQGGKEGLTANALKKGRWVVFGMGVLPGVRKGGVRLAGRLGNQSRGTHQAALAVTEEMRRT